MNSEYKRHIYLIVAVLILLVASLFILPISITIEMTDEPQETPPEERQYLDEEEVVIIENENVVESAEATSSEPEEVVLPIEKPYFQYVEVIEGCGPYFGGDCLNVRSGPGTDFDVVRRLRNGIVLKVGGVVEREGRTWYKITFDEWIRYPSRIQGDWYVAAEFVRVLLDEGDRNLHEEPDATTTKEIVVDRSEQKLYAYENGDLFMEETISTGLALTPTPRGTFSIFKKTPSRYMQGPLPGISSDYYDLPGVPWNLYFTKQGAVIHGAYWHNNFGKQWSHGCVNVPLSTAEKLYKWADLNTTVVVRD